MSLNICWSHVNSAANEAMALYSASVDDLDMVFCFFDFQDMSEFPRKMMNPVVDLLQCKQETQSASEKALRVRADVVE